MSLPEEAFAPILQELRRQSLGINAYRLKAGRGRSQAFGIVSKRSQPPDFSRNCWTRPYLYKLLLDFADKYVDIPFNAITVNENYAAAPHYDRNNVGESFLVAFGDYQGGGLKIHEGEKEGVWDVRHTPIVHDFSRALHSVEPFTGNRYSLVFYLYEDPRFVLDVPSPSVVEIDGKWFFKRGEKIITRKEGLPHPLRGRKHPPQ